jgi:pimeloyl-ACP methyl ester carboxylesterase
MSTTTDTGEITVVLVHGAFADGASWSGVTQRLLEAGVPTKVVVNPLRGVSADSAYVASVINQTPGRVLAVGHSYGGVVISNAAPQTNNVVGLVYVAAFAPEEGETVGEITDRSTDSVLGESVLPNEYPTGNGSETATELIVDPAKFYDVFSADLPKTMSDVLGHSQRPLAAAALGDKSGPPAWKNLPVWFVVATGDKAAGSDAVRSMAQRANATITELPGSHLIMVSQPEAVTEVILQALKSCS